MKKWVVTLMMLCLMCGCNEDMTAKIGELTATVRVLNEQVEDYQVASTEIVESLESAGIVDATVVAKLEKINEEIDKVQPQVADIIDAIDGIEPAGDSTLAIVQALQAANAASAPYNPYAGIITGVLALVTIILGMFAKKKSDEATANKAKYQAHKQGVEKTAINLEKDKQTELYENIGQARERLGVS